MPLQEMENGHPGEIYFKEAITIFKEWHISGRTGLASDPFTASGIYSSIYPCTACIQTMTAVLGSWRFLSICSVDMA